MPNKNVENSKISSIIVHSTLPIRFQATV